MHNVIWREHAPQGCWHHAIIFHTNMQHACCDRQLQKRRLTWRQYKWRLIQGSGDGSFFALLIWFMSNLMQLTLALFSQICGLLGTYRWVVKSCVFWDGWKRKLAYLHPYFSCSISHHKTCQLSISLPHDPLPSPENHLTPSIHATASGSVSMATSSTRDGAHSTHASHKTPCVSCLLWWLESWSGQELSS